MDGFASVGKKEENPLRKIIVFDSTLRDGELAPGCSMALREKLEMAKQLERLGVDVIEAGYPTSSPDDFDAVKSIAASVKDCIVCGLARCVERDIQRAWDALKGAKRPRLHLFAETEASRMKSQGLKQNDLAERTAAMVRFAKTLCPDVQFSAKGAVQTDREFLLRILDTAVAAGATTLSLEDSYGYCTPGEWKDLVAWVQNRLQNPNVILSVHPHNDLGMAVANALEGIHAGAGQVECTVNGIGERAGNAALEEIVMALYGRREFYGCETQIKHHEIYRSSKLLSTITGVPIPPSHPIVGVNVFSQDTSRYKDTAYDFLSPEQIGIHESSAILGKHTTIETFAQRVQELGYRLSDPDLEDAYNRFHGLAARKKEISDRDIEALLIGTSAQACKETYRLGSFIINCGTTISATAVVRLIKDTGEEIEQVARGEGPVNAAFKAIDKIVGVSSKLENWSMRAVTGGEDALGEAVSKIICSGKSVAGRGLSTDILDASIKSYLNAINKALALSQSSEFMV